MKPHQGQRVKFGPGVKPPTSDEMLMRRDSIATELRSHLWPDPAGMRQLSVTLQTQLVMDAIEALEA